MTPESPAGFSVAEAEQPIYFGRYVLYRGRVMPLVAGGESNGAPAAAGDGGAGGAGDGGDGASGPIPWDLSSVSEELRPHVEAALKGVEGGVTKRFQEHADFRKQWEPYAGVEGLSEISPEDMARLVAFHQTASDEQQFEQWLRNSRRDPEGPLQGARDGARQLQDVHARHDRARLRPHRHDGQAGDLPAAHRDEPVGHVDRGRRHAAGRRGPRWRRRDRAIRYHAEGSS
jgi:hypothetical protein